MDSILMHVNLNDGLTVTKKMLKNYPMQYIGLIGLDGKPKVKAFVFKFCLIYKHAIAITVKTVFFFDSFMISFKDKIFCCQSTYKH